MTVSDNCIEDVTLEFKEEIEISLGEHRATHSEGRLIVNVGYHVDIVNGDRGWFSGAERGAVVARLFLEVKETFKFSKNLGIEDVNRADTFFQSEEGSTWLSAWFEPWSHSGQGAKEQHSLAMTKHRQQKAQKVETQHSLAMTGRLETDQVTSNQMVAPYTVAPDVEQYPLATAQLEIEETLSNDVGTLEGALLPCDTDSPSALRTRSSPCVVLRSAAVEYCLYHGPTCPYRVSYESNVQRTSSSFKSGAQNATRNASQTPDNSGSRYLAGDQRRGAQRGDNRHLRGLSIKITERIELAFLVLSAALCAWNSGTVHG
ncbi:hypothetical protein N0V90_001713 [Kalmusia sp. IMI 367209]|nr:hypothetical protein N0V90_001713 [Kalmusia sp. IMI 367209]